MIKLFKNALSHVLENTRLERSGTDPDPTKRDPDPIRILLILRSRFDAPVSNYTLYILTNISTNINNEIESNWQHQIRILSGFVSSNETGSESDPDPRKNNKIRVRSGLIRIHCHFRYLGPALLARVDEIPPAYFTRPK